MGKAKLFLKLYRGRAAENVVLWILYTLLAAALSVVLLVQSNHRVLLENQLRKAGFGAGESLASAYQGAEQVLGMIAVAALLIAALGGACLIGFRNRALEKTQVMMHIFGMGKKDLVSKAALDAVIFTAVSSGAGYAVGYGLFIQFASDILQSDVKVRFLSWQALAVLMKIGVLILTLIFLSNLRIDFWMIERPVAESLYERKGEGGKQKSVYLSLALLSGIAFCSFFVFHVNRKILAAAGIFTLIIVTVLFFAFWLLFGVFAGRRRKQKRIHSVFDLSFCFLCSRKKRDALLAIVISIGTILLCIAANIRFEIGGILRSAYEDHMGYSTLIRADGLKQKEDIKSRLEELGVGYTCAYSKLMNYSELAAKVGEDGMFWAFVVEEQTDRNAHFFVPEGSFKAEKYFESRCNLRSGTKSSIFGKRIAYRGVIEDNQYLSLVNYSFIVNRADWKLGIDDTWSAVFLIDTSVSGEKRIEEALQDYDCRLESASKLIDELKDLMSDYLSLIILLASMILLVTAAVFYTVIRADLAARKTELYLYRVYGASFYKAGQVIFGEYIVIALAASLSVSFTLMFCGELYFYYGLEKHFPLSFPVIAITTGAAVLFVLLCCLMAGYVHTKNTGLEVIRDE